MASYHISSIGLKRIFNLNLTKPLMNIRTISQTSIVHSNHQETETEATEVNSVESYLNQLNSSSLEEPSFCQTSSDDHSPNSTTALDRIPPSPQWAMRLHPELYNPPTLSPTHKIHVATLAFEAYNPEKDQLPLVTGFALQAAYHLGIPVTKPASMPIKTELHTVLRSGFVHKKSQENFWRLTHRRVIKAYDTNEEVINRWINYLRQEGVRGTNVGIKAQRFLYRKPSWGEDLERLAQQEVDLEQTENRKLSKKSKKAKKTIITSSFNTPTEPAATDPNALGKILDGKVLSQADEVKRLAEQLIEKELKPRADALDKLLEEKGVDKGKVLIELKEKQGSK
ncbi:hypothetical protein DFH28DRAFT_238300 [Melampsora americana]|nr:hypothetical protein DFH28DRAFT_238300 [Melampsora americana]